jgi:SAM-dependent methyltransferase
MAAEFLDVTELAGSEISAEQLERMSHRYAWAADACRGRDVVEVGCGSGQGLGALRAVAKSLEAGDYSQPVLKVARAHYGERIQLSRFDAQELPFADSSKDVIILFEALYYVPDARRFVAECRRVLREGGAVLIATANKDLADFNPSPLSHRYYGAVELAQLFGSGGFSVELFGHLPVSGVSWRQRLLRPAKVAAVRMGLMPRTMHGKRLLKRLVFGEPVTMPAELPSGEPCSPEPSAISASVADTVHKVLYCRATLARHDSPGMTG